MHIWFIFLRIGTPSFSSNQKAEPKNAQDSARLQSKYSKASAISSDSFFGRDEDSAETQAKINKFSSSKAISSDAYFDREQQDGHVFFSKLFWFC